jgi:hypothetical protein
LYNWILLLLLFSVIFKYIQCISHIDNDSVFNHFHRYVIRLGLSVLLDENVKNTVVNFVRSSWLIWSHHFDSSTVVTMTWLTAMEYMCHKWPRICSTCRKHFLVFSSFMTYHGFVTRLTRRVPLEEQELLSLPEHLSSPPVLVGLVLLDL